MLSRMSHTFRFVALKWCMRPDRRPAYSQLGRDEHSTLVLGLIFLAYAWEAVDAMLRGLAEPEFRAQVIVLIERGAP